MAGFRVYKQSESVHNIYITKAQEIQIMAITINDHNYRNTYCKAPRGLGDWMFEFDGSNQKIIRLHGSYSEAKKQAVKYARELGYEYGQVLS